MWRALGAELMAWSRAGRVATFWWRDDDATRATEPLASMLRLRGEIPIALATIPGNMESSLPELVGTDDSISVLQHGWRHTNHGRSPLERGEFVASRNLDVAVDEIVQGKRILERTFGERFVPVFVPPWHQISDAVARQLPSAGLRWLSRSSTCPPIPRASVVRLDIHLNVADWSRGGCFAGHHHVLHALIRRLRAARISDERSPIIGFVTHHRTLGADGEDFFRRLLRITEESAAVAWRPVQAVCDAVERRA